jgi:triosephosphate isomerase
VNHSSYSFCFTFTEVVVAPPALYIDRVRANLKKEIGVAAQNSYVKASGAYTGEIR